MEGTTWYSQTDSFPAPGEILEEGDYTNTHLYLRIQEWKALPKLQSLLIPHAIQHFAYTYRPHTPQPLPHD